jgi:hypothetical protein
VATVTLVRQGWISAKQKEVGTSILTINLLFELIMRKGQLAGVLCLAILLLIASHFGVGQVRETPYVHLNRLIKLAAGVDQTAAAVANPLDQVFVTQYRLLIRSNQDYEAGLKQVDVKAIQRLSSPQLLASPGSAAGGLRDLHRAYNLEVEHEKKVRDAYAGLRRVFETAAWAASARPQLIKLLQNMIIVPSLKRQRCIDAEKAWIDSVDDLYHYAMEHEAELRLEDGAVTISDEGTLREFNAKVVLESIHRRGFLRKKEEYARMQSQTFSILAIDPKSVGIQ